MYPGPTIKSIDAIYGQVELTDEEWNAVDKQRGKMISEELKQQLAKVTKGGTIRSCIQIRDGVDPLTVIATAVTLSGEDETLMKIQVLKNINTVILETSAAFLTSLLEQPEVVSALPSKTNQDVMIRPVGPVEKI